MFPTAIFSCGVPQEISDLIHECLYETLQSRATLRTLRTNKCESKPDKCGAGAGVSEHSPDSRSGGEFTGPKQLSSCWPTAPRSTPASTLSPSRGAAHGRGLAARGSRY